MLASIEPSVKLNRRLIELSRHDHHSRMALGSGGFFDVMVFVMMQYTYAIWALLGVAAISGTAAMQAQAMGDLKSPSRARLFLTAETIPSPSRATGSIHAKVGEPVAVVFDIAGGSGFKWWPQEPLPDGVRFLGTSLKPHSPGLLGGTAQQTLTFAIDRPGEIAVDLVFRRSWLQATQGDPAVALWFVVRK